MRKRSIKDILILNSSLILIALGVYCILMGIVNPVVLKSLAVIGSVFLVVALAFLFEKITD